MDFTSLLGGGLGGGGGTSISPDNSQHATSSSNGQFGDHNIGLGAGNKSMILILAAVLIGLLIWKKA